MWTHLGRHYKKPTTNENANIWTGETNRVVTGQTKFHSFSELCGPCTRVPSAVCAVELHPLHTWPPPLSHTSSCQQTLRKKTCMTSLRQKPQLHPQTEHVIAPWDTFTIKKFLKKSGWVGSEKYNMGERKPKWENRGRGRVSWDGWTLSTLTSSLLPPLLCYASVLATSASTLCLCSLVCLPVILRWILWTMLAAQRTSSLRRAYRTWETSTTSVRAPVECQSTSAPFVGTAPQVMWEIEEGGEAWANKFTLPLTINIATQTTEGKITKRFISRLVVRFMSAYVDSLFAHLDCKTIRTPAFRSSKRECRKTRADGGKSHL